MMMLANQADGTTDQVRNKYNTLTPAEAKKLNRSLFNGAHLTPTSQTGQHAYHLYGSLRHAPVRTASVLHKPRAPPIVVTDLDTTIDQLEASVNLTSYPGHFSDASSNNNSPRQQQYALNRSASIRSGSLCSTGGVGHLDGRRHTINYGRASTMNSRSSLYSSTASPSANLRKSIINDQNQTQATFNESISNLSFKSSLDVPDCANYDPCRLQTISVDLGSYYNSGPNGNTRPDLVKKPQYDPMLHGKTIARIKYNTLSNASSKMFSDESYSSAQSALSSSTMRPGSVTPIKSECSSAAKLTKSSRSESKSSLSTSTYRVFHSPFANFKKLFRNIPRPFSGASEPETKLESHFKTASNDYSTSASKCFENSVSDLSIGVSASQLSLNKSQSPPVCPPPPGQLKSMCYMESAINYSNYDEFTRSRNEKMAQRQQALKASLNSTTTSKQMDDQNSVCSQETEGWQLTSLPVCYERNLTTVFEEKQASCEIGDKIKAQDDGNWRDPKAEHQCEEQNQHLIRPPIHFDDSGGGGGDTTLTNDNVVMMEHHNKLQKTSNGSMQSLNSCATSGSEHHQAPAKPYRFSFAQPLQPPCEPRVTQVPFQKNLGLPPRMPTEHNRLSINTSETTTSATATRLDNSSSGNSSNCSSQVNGINNCDRPNSVETSYNSSEDSNSMNMVRAGSNVAYGNLNGLADNEADITLLSETSTIQGDTGIAYYANRCSELERTVANLKNKLISKEKELTDLQVNQLNNDYTIDRLKKQLGKLERENGHLKTMVANKR